MYAQSRTKTVPYGFICGYPVGGVSSELYGFYEGQGGKSGSQGEAVVAAMKKWGENEAGTAGGTELGFPVCKRGYKPFGKAGCTTRETPEPAARGDALETTRGRHRGRRRTVPSPGMERFDRGPRRKPQTSARSRRLTRSDADGRAKA